MKNRESIVIELAERMSKAFETRTRDTGETFICLKENSPEWMTDVIREAHDDFMPDDFIFATCSAVVDAIIDQGQVDDVSALCDGIEDCYTSDLLKWVSSNLRRTTYIDEAMSEGLANDFCSALVAGQISEINNIASLLIQALEQVDSDEVLCD